jgi:phenylalanine-4-hydroxylase
MSVTGLTERIPDYLEPYIVRQDASLYTPMDHAGWRFILKISRSYFAQHAHQKYLDGLRETGISSDRIPLIEEMDQRLRKFGWRAVAVSGFIPPGVFMEFQSLGILPIACDMRQVEHLAYTPAPDIVHEAAGHAPLIASPDYSAYLRSYGELSRKAIFSSQDMDVYEAIRHLSIVKEDPASTEARIAAAQKRLDDAVAAVDYVSEATLLSRMGWWTFEYGLVGSVEQPKIFGAGLLSSVGESYHCLGPSVKKIPFSVDCVEVTYDITRPQPQLFVARDFQQLTDALEELARTMAFRQGGAPGLAKAVQAKTVTTSVLDSGLQISGTLAQVRPRLPGEPDGEPAAYLQFAGPTQLSFGDEELAGHGAKTHREGFGTPVGRVRGLGKPASELTDAEIAGLGGRIEFESGVVVQGKLKGKVSRGGKNLLLSFEDCVVTHGKDALFKPEWGVYDMACGARVLSVFGGAADRRSYLAATGGFKQEPGRPKTNLTEANRGLNALYAQVRAIRSGGDASSPAKLTELREIHDKLERDYPDDWLLRYELLELKTGAPWEQAARKRLDEIARSSSASGEKGDKGELIARGLEVL